jgi:hypothetical protein
LNNGVIYLLLSFPDESIDVLDELLKKSAQFIKDCFAALGAREYSIVFDLNAPERATHIDIAAVTTETRSGNNVFIVNKNLEVLRVDRMDYVSVVSVARYSVDNNTVLILVHNGVDISIYSKGVPIEQRNLNHPSALPVLNKKFNRPADDYKLSVIEFYREKVRTNLTDHLGRYKKKSIKRWSNGRNIPFCISTVAGG